MKVIVIASLEPEHLSSCLSALDLWVDSRDITVLNNANRPHLRDQINSVCDRAGLNPLRPHDICDGSNTISWLHETIKAVCRAFPDETVLKLDEDVFLVSAQERIDPPPYTFLVPNVTINNYTTKIYLDAFWPELAEVCRDHPWMWHQPYPSTGRDFRLELLDRIYGIDPVELITFCESNETTEEITAADWEARALMVGSDGRRGISTMAIAFRASDYLDLAGDIVGTEEIIIAESVWNGHARYLVDHGIYCHHVNYYPVREAVRAMPERVAAYHARIFDYYAHRDLADLATPVPPRPFPLEGDASALKLLAAPAWTSEDGLAELLSEWAEFTAVEDAACLYLLDDSGRPADETEALILEAARGVDFDTCANVRVLVEPARPHLHARLQLAVDGYILLRNASAEEHARCARAAGHRVLELGQLSDRLAHRS